MATLTPGALITADGDYDFDIGANYKSQQTNIVITGTFAGANIDIQEVSQIDSTNDAPITGGSNINAPWTGVIEHDQYSIIRFEVTNATGSTSLRIELKPVK